MDDITARQTLSQEGYIDYLISELLSDGEDDEDCSGDCHLTGEEKNNRRRTLKYPYFEYYNKDVEVEICGVLDGEFYVSKAYAADYVDFLYGGRTFRVSGRRLKRLLDRYMVRSRVVSLKNIDRFVVPIPRQVLLDNSKLS